MNRALTLTLTPLSLVYRVGIGLRNGLYRSHGFKSYDVGAPVISIGNLTTGGTGKTPLVEWLVNQLAIDGRRICVLTRGYRRASSGRVIVSDNHRVLSKVDEAGDEPFLLARKLVGRAAVICDPDRVAAARWAIENLQTELFVLDDGFQYQRIKRQVNIVLIDATNPFGNGWLLPAGDLREPPSELKRADCVIITRADESGEVRSLRADVAGLNRNLPIFTSRVTLAAVHALDKSSIVTGADRPVFAFCGIGNPNSFFGLLRRAGYEIVGTREFRDHHKYGQAEIDQLTGDAKKRGAAALFTTTKDAVKLASHKFALPCYAAEISLQVDNAEELLRYVSQAISETIE